MTFTPTDTTDYTTVSSKATINVGTATLTVTTNAQTKVYGTANPTLTGTVSGLQNGDNITAGYSTTALQFSDVAAGGYPITATPNDPDDRLPNYTVVNAGNTLMVTPANQTITWATPAAIIYGEALSSTQLDATVAGVSGGAAAGNLTYSPPAGTVLNAGNQTLSVTAAATQDYNAATDTVPLVVTPTAPTGLALAPASQANGCPDCTAQSAPTLTLSAPTGLTVQLLVGGNVVATATEVGERQLSGDPASGKAGGWHQPCHGGGQRRKCESAASTPLNLTYAPSFNQVYVVPGAVGAPQTLTATLNSSEASLHSEVGYVIAQDANGDVDGIAPGTPGYSLAAMSRAMTLFTDTTSPGSQTTITVPAGGYLVMYMVQFSSKQAFLAFNPYDLQFPSMWYDVITFFSVDAANPDGVRHAVASGDPTTGNVQYAWEDGWAGGKCATTTKQCFRSLNADPGQAGAALRVPGSKSDSGTLTAAWRCRRKPTAAAPAADFPPRGFRRVLRQRPGGRRPRRLDGRHVFPQQPGLCPRCPGDGQLPDLLDAGSAVGGTPSAQVSVSGTQAPAGLSNYADPYVAFYSSAAGPPPICWRPIPATAPAAGR